MLCLDARDIVGESVIWSAPESALYWVDIVGRRIHRFEPGGRHDLWPTPDYVTSIGMRESGGFVVGLRQTVCLWDKGGGFDVLATPEPDRQDNRLNEGRVAPDGAFWVGTMVDNLPRENGTARPLDRNSGAYYRVAANGDVTQLTPADYGVTNTMIWRQDGRFVAADTLANALYVFDHDAKRQSIGNRSLFAAGFDRGLPDGSAIDSDGGIWNCRVLGGGCVIRYAPDGTLDQTVELSCTSPTSCTFGGPGLATLYVTSSRFGMSEAEIAANPSDGGLFALDVGRRGVPENLFAG